MTSLQWTTKWPHEGFSYILIKIDINLDEKKIIYMYVPSLASYIQ